MRFLFLTFLLILAVGASAQTGTDLFHSAAGSFINGDMATAEQAAEAGLALDPNDTKLQALLELIREQQEQEHQQQEEEDRDESEQSNDQQDQQRGEEQSQQQDSGQENQGQSNQQQDNQEQPQNDGSGEPDQQGEEQEREHQGQANAAGTQGDEEKPDAQGATPGESEPVQPGQMSRAQAERILGALRADESALLRSIQRRSTNPRRVERDW